MQASLLLSTCLPTRLEQWYSRSCVADDVCRQRVDELKKEQSKCSRTLAQLDSEMVSVSIYPQLYTPMATQTALNEWLELCATQLPCIKDEGDTTDDDEVSACDAHTHREHVSADGRHVGHIQLCRVRCATQRSKHCKTHKSVRAAHAWLCVLVCARRCAAKFELLMNYDGPSVTANPRDIICLAYNKKTQMYCRRLRVICPEHGQFDKPNDTTACAAPIHPNINDGMLVYF